MNDAALLQDYLLGQVQLRGDATAVSAAGAHATYRTLGEQARRLASLLRRQGIARGDRVALLATSTIETVTAFWAVLFADAVAVPINPTAKTEKVAWILSDCEAAAIVTDTVRAHTARRAAARARVARVVEWHTEELDRALAAEDAEQGPAENIESDLAALIYTSGSQGEPKGVMLSHRNMLAASSSISEYLRLVSTDSVYCGLPLSFDYGLYQAILSARAGARVVLDSGVFLPADLMRRLVENQITVLPIVPTIAAMLSQLRDASRWDTSRVRVVTSTGAALPLKHIDTLQRIFPAARIFSMYGLTECKRCSYLPPEDLARKPGSVGIAIPNTELWIVDENARRVGPGVTGELVIRGATVMQGYWNRPTETARALCVDPATGDVVLHTGDLCRLDEDGYLYFVSRMDDVIKSRGEKVAPAEVEAALMKIAGIRQAAVAGVPDDLLGHAIRAFVVPEPGVTLDVSSVRRACADLLENFMVPRDIEVVADLPHTPSGKVNRRDLGSVWEHRKKTWRLLKGLRPSAIDLSRTHAIRKIEPERLRAPGIVEDLMLAAGLNDEGLDEFPQILHQHCGQGLRIWQYPVQFGPYLRFLAGLGVRSYLGLGVRHGGSFVFTVETLNRFQRLDWAVAVDVIPCPSLVDYAAENSEVSYAWLNSRSEDFASLCAELAPIDLAFVDSHHEAEHCRAELEALQPFASMIALHDITNAGCPGVRNVWLDLRQQSAYECVEFTAQYDDLGPFMGIGLAIRKDRMRGTT